MNPTPATQEPAKTKLGLTSGVIQARFKSSGWLRHCGTHLAPREEHARW
jgi:hypothetical protein